MLALMVLFTAVAGCSGGGDEPNDEPIQDDGTPPSGDDGGDNAGNGSVGDDDKEPAPADDDNQTAQPVTRAVTLTANQTSGVAPMTVTFNLTALGDGETYHLGHGDGSNQNGSFADMPSQVSYTYQVGGTFEAVLEITYPDEVLSDNVTIEVIVEDAASAPDAIHFEYGQSLGCFWDLATIGGGPAIPCVNQEAGPSAPNVDGFWQALDDRYWGLEFTSTVDHGEGQCSSDADWPLCDSDCFFYGDSTSFGDEIGDANNGGGACAGVVPEGTAWMFIFPYGGPSNGMVLDFVVPA